MRRVLALDAYVVYTFYASVVVYALSSTSRRRLETAKQRKTPPPISVTFRTEIFCASMRPPSTAAAVQHE